MWTHPESTCGQTFWHPVPRTAPLAWEHHGNSALRDGKWKIVTEYRDNQPTKWELYDMEADRTELHDLAATQPEKLKELADKWQAWADRRPRRRAALASETPRQIGNIRSSFRQSTTVA